MRIGKLEENVYKRINKHIKPCQNDLITAVKQTVINYDFAASAATIGALNEIYTAQADPISISVGLIYPLDATNEYALAIMEQISEVADKETVPVTNIDATSQKVEKAIVTITALGRTRNIAPAGKISGDVVIAGYVAGLGTSVMADVKYAELKKVFAEPFIKEASDIKNNLAVGKITQTAFSQGADYAYAFSEGGIFAGLWEMTEKLKSGMSIEIKKIPIRQDTIELSEVLQLNPYLLDSTGAVMIVAKNGQALSEKLNAEGIDAAFVGSLNEGNDRVLLNDGEVRYIDRPQSDEIYRLLEM